MKSIKRNEANGRRALSVVSNGTLYTSGISSSDLQGDITQQTRDALARIDKILQAENTDKSRVLFAGVTLRSMEDYGGFNAAWDEWVKDSEEPARNVVQGELTAEEYLVKIYVIASV